MGIRESNRLSDSGSGCAPPERLSKFRYGVCASQSKARNETLLTLTFLVKTI